MSKGTFDILIVKTMKDRIYIKDLNTKIGEEVIIAGWVDVRRDQGKMVFLICEI